MDNYQEFLIIDVDDQEPLVHRMYVWITSVANAYRISSTEQWGL